jgi:hypothetical protein
MSKNRYLYEDLRDLGIAWDELKQAILEALKSVLVRVNVCLETLSRWLDKVNRH